MEKDKKLLLLEKYWKAETTIEEEKALKQYFAEHHQAAIPGQEKHLFAAIEQYQHIQHEPVHFKLSEKENTGKLFRHRSLMGVASILLVAFCLSVWGISYKHKRQNENELLLQQKVQADLLSISQLLNQGYHTLNQSTELMLKVKSK